MNHYTFTIKLRNAVPLPAGVSVNITNTSGVPAAIYRDGRSQQSFSPLGVVLNPDGRVSFWSTETSLLVFVSVDGRQAVERVTPTDSVLWLDLEGSLLVDTQLEATDLVENTTDETAFNSQHTIRGGELEPLDLIQVRAAGIVQSSNASDTLNLKLKLGTGVIVETGAIDVSDNDIWRIEADLAVRVIGPAGKLYYQGTQALGTPGTVTAKPFMVLGASINTLADLLLSVTATWSAANAGNIVRCDYWSVERLNKAA